MIDTKLWEEIQERRALAKAERDVCVLLGDFIKSHAEKCMRDRNYTELEAWGNALKPVKDKLASVAAEYDELVKMAKEA